MCIAFAYVFVSCIRAFSSLLGFIFDLHFFLSYIAYHVIMCIAFAYVFVLCIRAFSPLSVLHSGAPMSFDGPFLPLFVCGC